ncbi:MAG: UPF0146 family protein [Haloarculaceae archaeon]
MLADRRHTLVARLSDCDGVVEVGVGRRPGVAAALAERGVDVTATDLRDRSTPEGVRFVRDDVTDPDLAVYRDADAVYARHCPPELQRPARDAARAVGVPFLFTTLGGDPTLVETRRVNAGDGTVFVADAESGPDAD